MAEDQRAQVVGPVDAGRGVLAEGTGEADDSDAGEACGVSLDDGVDEVLQEMSGGRKLDLKGGRERVKGEGDGVIPFFQKKKHSSNRAVIVKVRIIKTEADYRGSNRHAGNLIRIDLGLLKHGDECIVDSKTRVGGRGSFVP